MPDDAATATSGRESAAAAFVATVGFVGLGRMGRPMATHAIAGGFRVIGWDIDAGAISAAESEGFFPASSLAECAKGSDAILVIVPGDDEFITACMSEEGIFSAARPGTIVCACSSLLPETVWAMAGEAAECGLDFLDMPLTKGVRGAENATLAILVGGEEPILRRMQPVLRTFSSAVHLVGGVGAGQVAKSVNNILLWSGLESAVEALSLARAYGLQVDRLRQAMFDCSADSWVLRELHLVQPTWPAKDLENVARMADAVKMPMPLVDRLRELAGQINRRERITDLLETE